MGLQKFPDNDCMLYDNDDINSMWGRVMRQGENYIVVLCNFNACTLFEQDIKKAFPTWAGSEEPLETSSATISFNLASPTVACNEIVFDWRPERKQKSPVTAVAIESRLRISTTYGCIHLLLIAKIQKVEKGGEHPCSYRSFHY
jgi:hypothetical protein